MGIYQNMTRLACYIAQANMQDWNKQEIEEMVEFCGVKACIDFYEYYQARYGINCSKVLTWLEDIRFEQGEE